MSPRRTATEISADVVDSFSACSDSRLRELMQALVKHLHAFAEEAQLTPEEWSSAMTVLAESGAFTHDTRQEFILWSDVLGLSMVVDAIDSSPHPAATESTVE